ncbi:hypothetical protein ACFL1H_04915 [Nanoarchaeota archaeon]
MEMKLTFKQMHRGNESRTYEGDIEGVVKEIKKIKKEKYKIKLKTEDGLEEIIEVDTKIHKELLLNAKICYTEEKRECDNWKGNIRDDNNKLKYEMHTYKSGSIEILEGKYEGLGQNGIVYSWDK